MRILLLLLALAITGCAAECPVSDPSNGCIIGCSQYEYIASQIVGGGNAGATLVSDDYSRLYDTHVSTATRFEFTTSGAQTISSYWALEVFIGSQGSTTPEAVPYGMVGVLGTSLPDGAVIEIWGNGVGNTLLAQGTMQTDQSGLTTSAWLVFDPDDSIGLTPHIVFRNNNGGSTYMSNGYDLTIGEIFISDTVQFQLKRTPQISWAQIGKQRFSANGLTIPVLRPQIRSMSIEFAPIPQREAINQGTTDLMTVIYRMMSGNVFGIVPWEIEDPALYPLFVFNTAAAPESQKIRAKTAMLASFSQAPTVRNGGDKYFDGTSAFTESI